MVTNIVIMLIFRRGDRDKNCFNLLSIHFSGLLQIFLRFIIFSAGEVIAGDSVPRYGLLRVRLHELMTFSKNTHCDYTRQ